MSYYLVNHTKRELIELPFLNVFKNIHQISLKNKWSIADHVDLVKYTDLNLKLWNIVSTYLVLRDDSL